MRQISKIFINYLPDSINVLFNLIPYNVRLGHKYNEYRRNFKLFEEFSSIEKRNFIFHKFCKIVYYAYDKIPFYNQIYRDNRFYPDKLKCFDDIKRVPVIQKSDLMNINIEQRSTKLKGRVLTNTGGSSGKTLAFFCEPNPYAREWAHMHHIWSRLGYEYTDNKLTFRGVNIGQNPIKYSLVKNEYVVNAYLPHETTSAAIVRLLNNKKISYLHGYPSFIYDFSRYCAETNHELVARLRGSLKGIFLSSEFPAPTYRELIENVWEVPTLSWYGHSERVVLAFEKNKAYLYEPMHTYGYCEAVSGEDGSTHLVGTCFDNIASPFIRYDTGDLINIIDKDDGILTSFHIDQGREGEYIVDSKGHRISLTALIFGRHHKLFDFVNFIQIKQDKPGEATLLITKSEVGEQVNFAELFDSSNVEISFRFKVLDSPIRTKMGKIPLLVKVDSTE